MKFNRKYNHSTSKNVKNMSSSQASRALLESSTETFNSNSTVSINSSSETQTTNIYDNNNNSDIDQDSSLNGNLRTNSLKWIKVYLKPFVSILILITFVAIIIVLLCYFDNFYMQSTKSITTNTTTTITDKKFTNRTHFKWNHCGQTFYNPSINPLNLKRISKRIIGGEDAIEHSWPFLVSVRIKFNNKSEHQCGGTLITDQHILTAAHCILPYLNIVAKLKMNISEMFSLIEVHVGINEHEKNPKDLTNDHVYKVETFDFHENFNFNDWILVHDISIMKLKRKVNINRPEVNVACLPSLSMHTNKLIKEGEKVVAIGWGSYAEEYNYTAYVMNQLQQAVFTILDQDSELCNSGMIGTRWDRNYTICANGYEKKKVTCFGDSGGPVLAYRNKRWTLIGIISFAHDVKDYQTNKKKCNASMPFYFVNVEAYVDWIIKRTDHSLN